MLLDFTTARYGKKAVDLENPIIDMESDGVNKLIGIVIGK